MNKSQIIMTVVSTIGVGGLSRAFYIAGKELYENYKARKEGQRLSKNFEASSWQQSFTNLASKKNWLED